MAELEVVRDFLGGGGSIPTEKFQQLPFARVEVAQKAAKKFRPD